MDAQEEPDARSARRALLIFRLTFYPAALAIAIALLAARGGGDPEPMKTYAGMTGQNHRFIVGVRDDRVVFFDTVVRGRCGKGGTWDFHWYPTDGGSPPFVQADGRLQVASTFPAQYDNMTSQVELSLDGRWEDDRLRGTLTYRETFTPGAEPAFECAAEDVAFSVQR